MSGNPSGRPHKLAEARAALDEHRNHASVRELLAKLREMALAGEVAAMRLYLDRVLGPVRDPDDYAELFRDAPDEVMKWLASRLP